MLAGLEQPAYVAGMLCKAGEWSYLPQVASHLYYAALDLAEDWDLPRGVRQLKSLVYLALLEATGPSVACMRCEGAGKTRDALGVEATCELCQGRGQLPAMQRTRADMIGVNESNWKRTWRDRYRDIDQILQNWLTEASEHLNAALAGRSRRPEKRRA